MKHTFMTWGAGGRALHSIEGTFETFLREPVLSCLEGNMEPWKTWNLEKWWFPFGMAYFHGLCEFLIGYKHLILRHFNCHVSSPEGTQNETTEKYRKILEINHHFPENIPKTRCQEAFGCPGWVGHLGIFWRIPVLQGGIAQHSKSMKTSLGHWGLRNMIL